MERPTNEQVLAAYRTCGYEEGSLPVDHLPEEVSQQVWGLLSELVTTGIVQLGENPGEIAGEYPGTCTRCGKAGRPVVGKVTKRVVTACQDCYAVV